MRAVRRGRLIEGMVMNENKKSESVSGRKLPDPAICRAEPSGFGDSVDCLVKSPHGCPHVARMVFGMVCQHPERDAIIARTLSLIHISEPTRPY